MSSLAELQTRLGYHFRDENLLQLALTHPSVAHGQEQPLPHNQRLEFLGDAVLGLVLAHRLYEKFPAADEGPLTKTRAKLVNAVTLAGHGRTLGLGTHLIMTRGEENTGGRERESSLADAFEALVGAIFLDGGFAAANEFILRDFTADGRLLTGPDAIKNPKGELQELLQSRSPAAPEYQLISAVGPDHDRVFECAVRHEGVELGRGHGKSKKAAECEAAQAALAVLKKIQDLVPSEAALCSPVAAGVPPAVEGGIRPPGKQL
jgi:ribonuclease-3